MPSIQPPPVHRHARLVGIASWGEIPISPLSSRDSHPAIQGVRKDSRTSHSSPLTYARSRPGRFVGIASLLTALAGCGAQSAFHSAATAPIISPTPTMVLSAAYDLEGGQREVIFLTAENLSPDEIETLTASLENDLDVDVLPAEVAIRSDPDLPALTPVDPQTGSVGISLTLRRLVEVDTDEYEAVVTYARSGLDGGDIVFQWVRRQDTWEVADVVYPSQS